MTGALASGWRRAMSGSGGRVGPRRMMTDGERTGQRRAMSGSGERARPRRAMTGALALGPAGGAR